MVVAKKKKEREEKITRKRRRNTKKKKKEKGKGKKGKRDRERLIDASEKLNPVLNPFNRKLMFRCLAPITRHNT